MTRASTRCSPIPPIDAVVLATPHSQHVDEVVAAARAGKAVWCEKPLALTRAEAVRAVEACRAAGVAARERLQPALLCLDARARGAWSKSGALGDILHIEGHFSNEYSTHVIGGGWRDDPANRPGSA